MYRKQKISFDPPAITLDLLIKYGKNLVDEQDNVRRVQLAEAYMSGAELAGTDGSSMPPEVPHPSVLRADQSPVCICVLRSRVDDDRGQTRTAGACCIYQT